jgi:hypothetical protein
VSPSALWTREQQEDKAMKTTVRTSVFAVFAGVLLFGALGSALAGASSPTPAKGCLPACQKALVACQAKVACCARKVLRLKREIKECQAALSACEESRFQMPGDGWPEDGYPSGGAPLAYQDNEDGTFTDLNTGLMWEIKGGADDVADYNNPHDVDNGYTNPDGTAFTEFLKKLNARVGFAGHNDWRLPTVKELESLVDYSKDHPAVSDELPGATASSFYWSSTDALNTLGDGIAWYVSFGYGSGDFFYKHFGLHVRAVRGGW